MSLDEVVKTTYRASDMLKVVGWVCGWLLRLLM